MTDTTDRIIEAYYDILAAGAASYDEGRRLRPLLAADLVFEGPIAGHVVGADPFIKGVFGFIDTVRTITTLHRVYAGDTAAALYDAVMPGGGVRMAEFFRIDGGRIASLRLLYDPADYVGKGGR